MRKSARLLSPLTPANTAIIRIKKGVPMRQTVVFAARLLVFSCSQEESGQQGAASVPAQSGASITITSVSNRADLLSGGGALIEVNLPLALVGESAIITLNDSDVSSTFVRQSNGSLLGYVSNLGEGENKLIARSGELAAQLILTNHPKGGPIFSGPQVQPWICAQPTAKEGDAITPAITASGLQ
jgi:hypothetical protein